MIRREMSVQAEERDLEEPLSPEIPFHPYSADSDEEWGDVTVRHAKMLKLDLQSDSSKALIETVVEMKSILVKLCEKVDENKKSLKELQQSHLSLSSATKTALQETPKRKKACIIPARLRQEVRKTYWSLLEDSENFLGWETALGAGIKSPQNSQTMDKLVKEVKGINNSFDAADIREAAYRFYKTRCEEESNKRRGKADDVKIKKRRHERIVRKRNERSSAVHKNSKLTAEQKEKWLSVITNDTMSSEESGPDDSIVVHPLPWRSHYVNKMFDKIDQYNEHKKSPQAIRQMKRRVIGEDSSRPVPANVEQWAVSQ